MAADLLIWLLAVLIAVPTGVLLIQVLAALLPQEVCEMPGDRPKVAVLMPAHNEASGITEAIAAVRAQLSSRDRIVVVADNCIDDTASVARAAGAEVVERKEPDRRGKGYALAFGMRYLNMDPPAVVVVIDADCILSEGGLDVLARVCGQQQRPVQARDVMKCPSGATTGMRIAELAWLLKNVVRPLGARRLGLPCQLMGTGMAFPWSLLAGLPLRGDNLVEDIHLGIEAARAGAPPSYCPDVIVQSWFSRDSRVALQQRTRWEHGHLEAILLRVPSLIREGLLRRNRPLVALALDMCVPPVAFLALLTGTLLIGCLSLYLFDGRSGPLALAIADAGTLGTALLLAWVRFGRSVISFRELAYAPLYAVAKIPLYFNFIIRRQAEWVRTRRAGE